MPSKWARKWKAGKVFGSRLAAHHQKMLDQFFPKEPEQPRLMSDWSTHELVEYLRKK